MLRPEKMGRVSVTGSKAVLDDVVETAHEMNLLHLTDYDGGWEGFEPGSPTAGADRASEALVTVRSLESVLDVDETDAEGQPVLPDDLYAEIEEVREQVNELDDRQDELQDELRNVEENLDAVRPFVQLGIDLDLLGGYDSLSVAVGEGDEESVKSALTDQPGVDAYETFAGEGDVLAVFAYPDVDVTDALVSAQFTTYEVPDLGDDGESVSPDQYVEQLEQRQRELESKLDTVADQLDDLRVEVGGFLLAAEEKLAVQVQKAEAPLSFATTANAFVAEGWLPYDEYVELQEGLQDAVGDHVDVDLVEVAEYDGEGHPTASEEVAGGAGGGVADPTAADGGEVASDGGRDLGRVTEADVATDGAGADVAMGHSSPPVIQDNPGPVKPFEALTNVINLPKYDEFDPTVVLFLTFPAFFGFMIGDLGYGLLYMAIGGLLYTKVDSDVLKSLGGVALWAGGFTALFGILYGEIFGLHTISTVLWEGTLGMKSAPMHKGLQPADLGYAQGWMMLVLTLGVLHVGLGYVFGFVEEAGHSLKEAVLEHASWALLMFGVWIWVFSRHAAAAKPNFLYLAFNDVGANPAFLGLAEPATEVQVAYSLGFAGLPETVGLAGLGVAVVGFALLFAAEGPIALLESLNVLVNVLSYARIAAVLLAKAGMAFVVNLLFFGAYETHGEFHFMLTKGPEKALAAHPDATIMFPGLIHSGVAAVVLGFLVLVIGHLLVLVLGITSAGLQAVRLEYVEFFQKFYEGGGDEYEPFGYETRFAGDD
jgi:V/A-type H+-transporting ATPase subunit I